MIRHAVEDDMPAIMVMAEQFVATTRYHSHIAIDPERLMALMRSLIADAEKALIVSQGSDGTLNGMIAVTVYDHPMSTIRVGYELCWWVNPQARGTLGIRLLHAAVKWAIDQGAQSMQMTAPSEAVERIYQRLGFERVETLYQKVLTDADRDNSSDSHGGQRGHHRRQSSVRREEARAGSEASSGH